MDAEFVVAALWMWTCQLEFGIAHGLMDAGFVMAALLIIIYDLDFEVVLE